MRTFLAIARQKNRDHRPVALADVVQNAIALAAYGFKADGVQVDCRIARDLPAVLADEDQLHQVVTNLLVNSVRYTPEAGTVRIDAGRAGLTTVRQPLLEKGRIAGELLLQRGDRNRSRRVTLPTELVVGNTSAAPRAAERFFSGW